MLLILIILSLFVLSLSDTINANKSSKEILINVQHDQCLVIISKDGHQRFCEGTDKTFTITSNSISRYDKVGVIIYNTRTGIIEDAKVIDIKNDLFNGNIINEDLSSNNITILWPRFKTITTNTIDIHYFINNLNDNNKICARVSNLSKNNINSDVSKTYVNNDDIIKCYDPSYVIYIEDLINGEYCIHLYKYHGDISAIREYTIKSNPDASTCFKVELPVSLLPSIKWGEIPKPIALSNQECNIQDDQNIIHIVIMSVNSVDRYEEAEVHLKSLIFNRNLTPKNKRANIVLHMIVDDGGKEYFSNIYLKENLQKFDDIHIIFHNFEYVCMKPLEKFLKSLDMKESFHHSGKAGYCRLFIPEYFQKLNETIVSINDDSIDMKYILTLLPSDTFITLETDQLMLVSVDNLYEQFKMFDDDDIIAAPENYQPWEDSRPFQSQNNDKNIIITINNTINHDGSYHGHGIIGGVMLFNLTRIKNMTFMENIKFSLNNYVDNYSDNDMKWEPRLNDQDIFNVFFKSNGHILRILSCDWNIQLHARINTIIQCLDYPTNGDNTYRFSKIPKKCANSINNNIFVCEKQPKCVHFMAQSYIDYDFLEFYSGFWLNYKTLSWSDII